MISESSSSDVLGLRFEPDRLQCALQPLVERLLSLIREKACGPEPTTDLKQLGQRLDGLYKTLLDGQNRHKAMELTDPIVALCAKLLEGPPRGTSSKEVTAALTVVRDVVASVEGVEQSLQRSLTESVDKLYALQQFDDLTLLKTGLARQIDVLKDLSSKRELQWRRQLASVERKVRSLETRLAETRLEARYDALTGLFNRRSIETSFKIFQDARRQFVLALFDVDDFKRINDMHGHLAGDAALKLLAKTLQSSVRSHDLVGRFGGDEFIVMMVDVSLPLAERRLFSVLQTLRAMMPIGETGLKITATCGVSEFSAGDSFETLVARADQALYDAKQAGKNRLGVKSVPYIRDLSRRK